MHSRIYQTSFTGLLLALFTITGWAQEPVGKKPPRTNDTIAASIARIEAGLLPALIVRQPGQAVDVRMKLADRMRHYKVPGLSIAVINQNRVEWARGYGLLTAKGQPAVSPDTLFQAGSISKPVTALAALKLVEQGRLWLDEDINRQLKSWQVPENEFTRQQPVTLRRLLSHSAGLTVRGFDGYAVNEPVPTLRQILNGEKPANSAPIRVEVLPGTQNRYSGGGYTVLQQLLLDVTGQPFDEWLKKTVLQPLGMQRSTFTNPLPARWQASAAIGHRANGEPLTGGWRVYPEMAAAGLWATPSDLARIVIELQQVRTGQSRKLISPAMLEQMLTPQTGDSGLGWGLKGAPRPFRFSHSGSTEGYSCFLLGFTETGQGAVVMTNSDNGNELLMELLRAVAAEYNWPDLRPEERVLAQVNPQIYESYVGQYDWGGTMTIISENGKLYAQPQGRARAELLPESDTTFFLLMAGNPRLIFVRDAQGRVNEFIFRRGTTETKARRIQ